MVRFLSHDSCQFPWILRYEEGFAAKTRGKAGWEKGRGREEPPFLPPISFVDLSLVFSANEISLTKLERNRQLRRQLATDMTKAPLGLATVSVGILMITFVFDCC